MHGLHLTLLDTSRLISKVAITIGILISNVGEVLFALLCIVRFFLEFFILISMEWYYIVVLIRVVYLPFFKFAFGNLSISRFWPL